jgi:PAS domain S-box-containing protein
MSLKENNRKGDLLTAFSNLRLLTFLFIFFIFLIFGTTVLVISSQTKDNIISLTRSEVQSNAAIAALQIDGDILASIRPGDEKDPHFLAIRDQLEAIRKTDDKIRFIYTMRRSASGVEFVVDGDYGLSSDAAGIGETYPNLYPELLEGFVKPSSDPEFTSDAWGTFLSGYAPIRNSRGDVVGIIGIDLDQKAVVERLNYLNGIFFLLGIISILAAVVGIIVIERRRSIDEEVMQANRNYLTQIFESVRAGIIIIDAESHNIVDANPSALAMIGESKEICIGKVCHSFICPADLGKCPISDLGQSVDSSERVLLTAGGSRIPIIKYVVPLVLDGRPCLLETFVDITDRKKAEDDLVAAIRKLKILSVVTRNEIITDIYALEGYLELIRDDMPLMQEHPLSKKIDWVMGRIRIKTAFFKDYDESGTKEPVWQNVAASVNAALQILHPPRLSVIAEDTGLEIYADPLLEKVFFHLLDNTLRHGEHATGVRISQRVSDDALVLMYEDNGVGVPAEDKERIFERGVGSLTGLGLFFAREVLDLTGISLRECGVPGAGVRFEMIVPNGKYRLATAADPNRIPAPGES